MNVLIPHNWLTEYLKTNLKPKEIAEKLSLGGISVEKLERVPSGLVNGTEYVYDIEVTSNRPDTMSVIGVAREGAAILNKECVLPKVPEIFSSRQRALLSIEIKEPQLCRRYLGVVLDHIEVKPSPEPIQQRLKLAGLRPINNIVDITNYVMLEYGPLHAFDLDLLNKDEKGNAKIIIRKAKKGEKVITLDKQHFELKPDMLVIADSKEPIAIAGIKGGLKAEVTAKTERIVLECASFDPISIRKTSRALSLQTDASVRFDKDLVPLGREVAFRRAVDLLQKFAGAKIASRVVDAYPKKIKSKKIEFHFSTVERILGAKIPQARAFRILQSLGFKVAGSGKKVVISVPYWRHNDIEREEDFVEEVARVYGYHKLSGKLMDTRIPKEVRTKSFEWEDRAKDILVSQGFSEVYTYSFVSKRLLEQSGSDSKKHLKIANPLSQEFEYMRRELLPSLFEVAKRNYKKFLEIKIFELNHVYSGEALPYERRRLGGLLLAKRGKDDLFYKLKGVLENLLTGLGISDFVFEKETERGSMIKVCGKKVGTLSLVKSYLFLVNFGITDPVFAFDLDFEELAKHVSESKSYTTIPKYPAIEFDLSVVVAREVPWLEIQTLVEKADRLVRKVELFDVYQGKRIGTGKKSLAFRITYRSDSRSLKQEEARRIHDKIIVKLKKDFQAQIRE